MATPFISRVTLKNYKSIAACQVDLQDMTVLVGPNGSGKSNFLDALKFVADGLNGGLDFALRKRGTIREVRRRAHDDTEDFSIRLDFTLNTGQSGHYAFRIGSSGRSAPGVREEECDFDNMTGDAKNFFRVLDGKVVASSVPEPAVVNDRLALVNFAGNTYFRPVFNQLAAMELYNLDPRKLSEPQTIDGSTVLKPDGSNAANVLRQVDPDDLKLIESFLGRIVPTVHEVVVNEMGGGFDSLEFRQDMTGTTDGWHYPASSVSEGTLRAFGILLAVWQSKFKGPYLVGIEEPENAIHPAAARLILEALQLGSERRQIIITSHSPDLLDDPDLPSECLLKAENRHGITYIDSIDEASKDVIRRHLCTPGELLRENQLGLAETSLSPKSEADLNMFSLEDSA